MNEATKELVKLHNDPENFCTENPDICLTWKGRQDAYSRLISIANVKCKPLPEHIVTEVSIIIRSQNLVHNDRFYLSNIVVKVHAFLYISYSISCLIQSQYPKARPN